MLIDFIRQACVSAAATFAEPAKPQASAPVVQTPSDEVVLRNLHSRRAALEKRMDAIRAEIARNDRCLIQARTELAQVLGHIRDVENGRSRPW